MNQKIYPSESAGRKMIDNVPLAFPEERISDIKKRIFEKAQEFETLNYIYVVNKEKMLVGILSLKEIFQKPEKTKIGEIMIKKLIIAHPFTDQEKVAILALRHNLKSIPVVDKENKFLGVVSSDTILDILHLEQIEDILKLGGISLPQINIFPENLIKTPVKVLIKARFPWLFLGLLGGIFAAQITAFFETPLKTHFILAAFIPLIVYMAAAAGNQTQTLTVRNLTLNSQLSFKKYLLREIKISFLLGLVLGFLLFLISILGQQQPIYIGLILGISLFFTIISAIFVGFLIPCFLQKLKKDPAVGSGPFATIITDIISLIIYFSIASLLLEFF